MKLILTGVKRTRLKNPKGEKRLSAGNNSIGWKIWNTYNPDNPIIPNTGYIIHHIDENPNNNLPTNLLKMTDIDHKKHHTSNGKHPNQGKKFSKKLKEKLSKSHLGQKAWNKGLTNIYSKETLYEMGSGRRGKPSPCGMLGKKHSQETREKMSKSHFKRLYNE